MQKLTKIIVRWFTYMVAKNNVHNLVTFICFDFRLVTLKVSFQIWITNIKSHVFFFFFCEFLVKPRSHCKRIFYENHYCFSKDNTSWLNIINFHGTSAGKKYAIAYIRLQGIFNVRTKQCICTWWLCFSDEFRPECNLTMLFLICIYFIVIHSDQTQN